MSEKKRTSFYLDEQIIERLREMAEAERRSMSAQIECYVDDHWRGYQHQLVDTKVSYDVEPANA